MSLLLTIAGLAGAAQAEATKDFTRHAHGWSITYPSSWQADTKDPGDARFTDPTGRAICGVHSGPTGLATSDQLADLLLQIGREHLEASGGPRPLVRDRSPIKAPPATAGLRVLVDLDPGGRSLRGYFVTSARYVVLDCETYVTDWDKFGAAFDAILASLSFAKTEAARTFEAAHEKARFGLFEEALPLYRAAAEAGDARAQYMLASMLFFGEGTAKDTATALSWLEKSALNGNLDAQVALWQAKLAAKPMAAHDREEGLFWLLTAARNGDAYSQNDLGHRLLRGDALTTPDTAEAYRWLRSAGLGGIVEAQHSLGTMLMDGVNGAADPDAAYAWLSLAVKNGSTASIPLRDKAAEGLPDANRKDLDAQVARCLASRYRDCPFAGP